MNIDKLVPQTVTECSLSKGPDCKVCSSDATVNVISKVVDAQQAKPEEVIEKAKFKTNCTSEKCVVKKLHGEIAKVNPAVTQELVTNFKVDGPRDAALLSNIDIDKVLKQWMVLYPQFFAYNFNMRDFESNSMGKPGRPDTLATITFDKLYESGFRCAACVINSDIYSGPGKHWMALFIDARSDQKWTVEFFNSSGNAPAAEWIRWMNKTADILTIMSASLGKKIEIEKIVASKVRHQRSKSECGVYSLFYIWARLNGVPANVIGSTAIADEHMFRMRQHLFNDSKIILSGKFDFNKYQKVVTIRWHKGDENEP